MSADQPEITSSLSAVPVAAAQDDTAESAYVEVSVSGFGLTQEYIAPAVQAVTTLHFPPAARCRSVRKPCPAGPANTCCWFVTVARAQIQGLLAHQQDK